MNNLNGVIDELILGTWKNPTNNNLVSLPIKKIEISKSL